MPKAFRIHKNGGPEVMAWEEVPVGAPGPGEARVRHHAVGLNYIDTYHRTGLYPVTLPSGLGSEGAGVVEAVGPQVEEFKPGDRVAYAGGPLGAYSEVRNIPAVYLVKLPDSIPFEQAAAMMLQGMTAQYLIKRTYITRPSLVPYTAKRSDLLSTAQDLFNMVLSGKVKIEMNQRYALKDAAQAHRDLEARRTTGSTALVP